jgi:cytoskeletal protein RodZ
MDLRSSRKRKGVSLEQIADATKISIRFLRAIEAEEFDKLPGGIFTTSYLRQYASAVGIEESRLLGYYQSKQDRVEPADVVVGGDESRTSILRFWRAPAAAGR